MSSTAHYIRWQDGDMRLGYFEQFPGYLTQDESLTELEENLRDLYRDFNSGEIAGIRSVAEIAVRYPARRQARLVSAPSNGCCSADSAPS